MLPRRNPIKGFFKAASVFTIEFLAIITTLFAFYEIFLAKRLAPAYESRVTDCKVAQRDMNDFREFLTDHQEKFVYFRINIADWSSCLSLDIERFDDEVFLSVGFDQRYSDDEYNLTEEALKLGITDSDSRAHKGYLVYDKKSFQSEILSRIDIAEDFETEILSGLIFLTNKPNEGDNYFELVPAPYESDTLKILKCTQATYNQKWPNYFFKYVSNCILN